MKRYFTALSDIIGDDGLPVFFKGTQYEFISPSSNPNIFGEIRLPFVGDRLTYDVTTAAYADLINHPHLIEDLPF